MRESEVGFKPGLTVRQVACFEKGNSLGGVFARCYEDALLTSSSIQTAFSSYSNGKEASPVMWPTQEYNQYLHDYARHFDVERFITLNATVVAVRRVERDGGVCWEVDVCPSDTPGLTPVQTHSADHVAVCCGAHNVFQRTPYPGEDGFAGVILHSSEYKRASEFTGKRVVVVGLGESGSDVCLQIARVASASCYSMRSGPGYVIPRYFTGAVSDLDTTRCYHALPRWLGGTLFSRVKHMLESSVVTDSEERAMLQAVDRVNQVVGLPWQRRFGTKNTGFLEAEMKHGMQPKPNVDHIEGVYAGVGASLHL